MRNITLADEELPGQSMLKEATFHVIGGAGHHRN